jgi:hypothetical protein
MLRPANVSRHLTTRFCAAPADFRAIAHDLIVAGKAFAIFSTALADFGTDLAGARVQVRIAEHEISAGLADLGAVEQQRNMVRLCMSAALLQAMRKRFQTNIVTLGHDFYVCIALMSMVSSFREANYARKMPGYEIMAHQ